MSGTPARRARSTSAIIISTTGAGHVSSILFGNCQRCLRGGTWHQSYGCSLSRFFCVSGEMRYEKYSGGGNVEPVNSLTPTNTTQRPPKKNNVLSVISYRGIKMAVFCFLWMFAWCCFSHYIAGAKILSWVSFFIYSMCAGVHFLWLSAFFSKYLFQGKKICTFQIWKVSSDNLHPFHRVWSVKPEPMLKTSFMHVCLTGDLN